MDLSMQQKCDAKLRELQECMPFLLQVLEKLRNNNRNDPARQTQLEKIQKLYNLLSDKTQTFKWELLVKCENVVNKLQKKMELQGEHNMLNKSASPSTGEKNHEEKESSNEMKREDLNCPESPPPFQLEDFRHIQPVVIPTERRCSPPLSSNRKDQQNGKRQDRKSSHSQQYHHRHHHHHDHHHHRHKQHDGTTKESLKEKSSDKRGSYNVKNPSSFLEQDVDQYLITQRKHEEENRHNIWKRRDYNSDVHNFEKAWPEKTNTNTSSFHNSAQKFSTIISQLNAKQPNSNVFSRLGEKVKDIHKDKVTRINSEPKKTNFTAKDTPPIISDILKSPPLSAKDITLLLNDTSNNSNSNEPVGISAIGTRRSTPASLAISKPTTTQFDSNSSLDIVRKKFAMLTKTEVVADSPASPNQTKSYGNIFSNSEKPTTSTSSVREAMKYNSFSRSSTHGQSNNTTEKHTSSPSIPPNANVNVLPTLRPNDPRLRKINVNTDCSSMTLPLNNSLSLRQSVSPKIASQSGNLISPILNSSLTPNTPSPIYGNALPTNSHLSPVPVPTAIPNDPRLQRNRLQQSSSSCTTTQKRPLLVSGDSSDENWDLDDNARDMIFPQPRPFPNRNSTYMNVQSGLHNLGGPSIPALPLRRPSSSQWDNPFRTTTNNSITTPNNFNFKGNLTNIDDPNTFVNTNWHGTSAAAAGSVHYNANSLKPNSNDIFKTVQSNLLSPEHQNFSVPRTYGAYKEARARAVAEQAARKAAAETKTEKTFHETEEERKDSTAANTKVCSPTGLDTKYRNTNLKHSDLPKGMDFKIPKKSAISPALSDSNEKSTVEDEKEKKEKPLNKKCEEIPSQKEADKEQHFDSSIESNSTSKTNSPKDLIAEQVQPKSQRARFKEKGTNIVTSSSKPLKSPSKNKKNDTNNKSSSDAVPNEVSETIDKVDNSNKDSVVEKETTKDRQPQSRSPKLEFLSAVPARIVKRRCTMIEKPSVPEVDKEQLGKVNAMLFEDLQEQERKKISEEGNKVQTTTNRRHGEICYERTDDGCTVSTQNIISGKRRTRTRANFNEVQQGIAVFKHLKSSEPKKDVTTSTSNLDGAAQERKGKPKGKPKGKANKKIAVEKTKRKTPEGGNKIRKRQKISVDTKDGIKVKQDETSDEDENKDESINKSSEAQLPNVTSIFDAFIQKILNPKTNADEIVDKLKDILSEQEVEALISLRKARLKKHAADDNNYNSIENFDADDEKSTAEHEANNDKKIENISENKIKTEKEEIDSNNTEMECANQTETTHLKSKTPRRNELDRLHDDIRDMFISEGVLTATGKRVCRFVEPDDTKTVEPELNNESTETQTISSKPPRLRKARVMLPTVKIQNIVTRRSLRKAQPIFNSNEDTQDDTAKSENDDEDADTNSGCVGDTSLSSDVTQISSKTTTVSTISSVSSYTKSDNEAVRQIPELKPLKPLRSDEENELDLHSKSLNTATDDVKKKEKTKQKRYKPCPKSKKPLNALLDDDHEDNENVENYTNFVDRIKTECIDVPYEDVITNFKEGKTPPKNVNPKWHWVSRYAQKCAVCKQKCTFISAHYKKFHSENYVSRLAPIILQQLKKRPTLINKPLMRLNNKKSSVMLFRCPFCLQLKRTTCIGWLEHFITHTGEYFYECTLCHSSFNKPNLIERHMREKCASLGGRYLHNADFDRTFKNQEIKAHVCHLCNFLRLGRGGLERHYMEQHGFDVKDINDTLGYEITLMNMKDVPIVKTVEELTKMEIKLIPEYQSELISLDDEIESENTKDIVQQQQQQSSDNEVVESPSTAVKLDKKEDNFPRPKNSPANGSFSKKVQKGGIKQKSVKAKEGVENKTITLCINSSSKSSSNENSVNEATSITLSVPVSSAFMSTTDDSNDEETPSILARKLFTVDDETELCNKSQSKAKLGGAMSMAERLAQRLKEAEAITSAQQKLKEAETNSTISPIQQHESTVRENTSEQEERQRTGSEEITGTTTVHQHLESDDVSVTPRQQEKINSENRTSITPVQQQSISTENSTSIQNIQKNTEGPSAQLPTNELDKKDTQLPSIYTKDDPVVDSVDKNEGEIDLTQEEDDDGWEDIEIVETAPSSISANKDSKTQKNKINPLQKFSRFYGTMTPGAKANKKSNKFNPLMTLFSGVSSTGKDNNQAAKETPKTIPNTEKSSAVSTTTIATTTSSTSTFSDPSVKTTSTPVLGFRPMIASLDDLLPDSPSADPIELAPELAPSGPLQDLNDISNLLGSNLGNLMDIDVEDPTNSVCIHNTDNQQTSIQEALDFVASQSTDYEVEHALGQSLSSSNTIDDALVIAPVSMKRIQNIGYTCLTDALSNSPAFKFYCFSDRCTFLYSSEAIGLENHFLLEHPQSKWNGYCEICASHIEVGKSSNDLKFSDEFNHLLSVHIKETNLNTQSSASINTTKIHNESSCSSNVEQPRLKLRRLSGDCLSTATMQSDSLSNSILETYDDASSFSDLIRFNTCTMPNDQADRIVETFIPTSVECLPNDVPFFTNISKDFEITSISSGLEPTELSAIVKSALGTEMKSSDKRNTCNLQISNVVSLGEDLLKDNSANNLSVAVPKTSSVLMPKIANVCSLKKNSESKRIGSLWSQQISQERNELVQSASESMEVSALLANSNSPNAVACRNNNDSPGPMIVSETLPVGQATAGDFLITQTVSAQYSDESTVGNTKPQLGFNISISSAAVANAKQSSQSPVLLPTSSSASIENGGETVSKASSTLKPNLQCMDVSCKFTTRHLVAIIDHVKWHEKKNDAEHHEYLRCSLCQEKLKTVDNFTEHVRMEHFGNSVAAVPETPDRDTQPTSNLLQDSCPLTEKIRNILNKNQVEISTTEGAINKNSETSKNPNTNTSGSSTQNVNEESNLHKTKLLKTIKEMVAKTGLSGKKLFRCSVKDCNVKLNDTSFHIHVLYHLSTLGNLHNVFPCPHCKAKCQSISVLKTHIKNHGRHRIFCYLCMETTVNDSQMSKHFAQKHWQKKELHKSILEQENLDDGNSVTYYVTNLSPLNENNVHDFGNKLIIEWKRKKAATRTHFNPDEVELLPIQAIFSKEIYCARCFYKTKVRTNMVRHMIQHKNTPISLENSTGGSPNISNTDQKDGNSNDSMPVCNMDPVNPVPCLISKEKHFDRMTNLASSSHGSVVPQGAANTILNSVAVCKLRYAYIPPSKRFKCAVIGCEYLTICEDVFRTHLSSAHNEGRSYKCLFCNEELCKRTFQIEKILLHLRFHDRIIYQCEQCSHNHYIRHIVDRHALEKHGIVPRANVLMFTRDIEGSLEGTKKVLVTYGKKIKDAIADGNNSEAPQNVANEIKVGSSNASAATSAKSTQKYPKFICDLCQHKTITFNQLIAHSNSQHGFRQPYQCPYCVYFTAWAEQNVKTHISTEHSGEDLKVNRLFGKMTPAQQIKAKKEFLEQQHLNLNEPPPKPLWQRDDPKRARQIRGIPMEDEEESERLRKRLRLNEDYYDEEDVEVIESKSGNPLGHSTTNLYLNRFEFGCFHCEHKTNSLDDLKNAHWNTVHSTNDGLSRSSPFLFRLLVRLKCSECQNFIGCFWELQKHMAVDHKKPTSHALDPRAKKLVCGYCEYDCGNATQLLRHHLIQDHQPQDVKGITSVEMAKVMRLECSSPVSFVHCSLCSELFSSRLAVVQHAGEKHGDETEHFSFRELNNKTIYRCPECSYSSTDELTTLRHMVNHYNRFKRCNFCFLPQMSFNDYMQHCYSEHRVEIKRFSEIYTFNHIQKYLMQLLIIFPNGWIINKKNLSNTPYGNDERLKTLYAEICKTSQEPPIPRLSLGRLVARKSIEARLQQSQNQQSDSTSTMTAMQLDSSAIIKSKKQTSAQKISKRRSTIAVSNEDANPYANIGKKPKLSKSSHIETIRTIGLPLPPKFKIAEEPVQTIKNNEEIELPLKPYSYYGKRPVDENWSKLHTKISIAGINTPITLDKFKILVKINAQVVLDKLDVNKYKFSKSMSCREEEEEDNINTVEDDSSKNQNQNDNKYEHVKKACPASQKYRFI